MAATGIHISIAAEPIFSIGGFTVTNSIFTSLIVSALLLLFALTVRSKLTNTKRPTGLQNFAEWLIESLYGLVYSVTGNARKSRLFLPLIATFFLFILLNNWLGLFPGVGTIGITHETADGEPEEHATTGIVESAQAATEPITASEEAVFILQDDHATAIDTESSFASDETDPSLEIVEETIILHENEKSQTTPSSDDALNVTHTEETDEAAAHSKFVPIFRPGSADLNTTLALALIAVGATQLYGYHFQKFGYFKKFINFSSPIMFFVGILEIVSEFAKVISFAFRLFGNIFAGEVLLTVIMFLVPLFVPMPFYGLEIFVGFIQALVFAMLTLVFFNMASESHDSH